jgi:alkylation response protein AidB-like acyl-CoA dehydrogenase
MMMALDNKELTLLHKTSREFARKELAPGREENDKHPFGPFFQHTLDQAFALDFFHITLPKELGGVGHGIEELCVVMGNICEEDSSLGGILFTHLLSQEILLRADEENRLKQVAADAKNAADFLIATSAMANPSEGWELPVAKKEGDSYHLTGSIDYVVTGGVARHALIPATIHSETGFSYFWTDLTQQRIDKSDPVLSHGLNACPAVDLRFNHAGAALIGEAQRGEEYFRKAFTPMQLVAAAMASGIMRGSFNEALAYCRDRRQGGRKLKEWSLMQMMLSELSIRLHVSEMLLSRACEAITQGEKGAESAVQAAAFHILSSATELTSDGIQAMGGVGYMKDFGQEKRFRDAGQVQALLGIFPMKKIRFFREFIDSGIKTRNP